MSSLLNNQVKSQIQEYAHYHSSIESGGLILDRGEMIVFPCKNVSSDPENHYLADQKDISICQKSNTIAGFFHSHLTQAGFSQADIVIAEKLKLPSIVYCLKDDSFYEYQPVGFEMPYEGREFYFRVLDCLTLAIDYYHRELNIDLNYINHYALDNMKSWKELPANDDLTNAMERYLISEGFSKTGELKKHDILILQPDGTKFPCHFGVYLGNDRFLHQMTELSAVSLYGKYWKKKTKGVFRHNKLS